MLGFLVLLLLLPVSRILSLVHERMARRDMVTAEITRTWGGPQALTGPVLTLPVRIGRQVPIIQRVQADDGSTVEVPATVDGEVTTRTVWESHDLQILPSKLTWTGRIEPDVRNRGLFEVVVYEANLRAVGSFEMPEVEAEGRQVDWPRAEVALGVPDVRGLTQEVDLTWGDRSLELQPGVGRSGQVGYGIHTPIPDLDQVAVGDTVFFAFDLALRGAGDLLFVPAGTTTEVRIESPWPAPGFTGAFLPAERQISDQGFSAAWEVPSFGRGFPEVGWTKEVEPHVLTSSAFGVSLVLEADAYQQTERSVKYAVLFIILTFGTFFLLELLSRSRLHAVQYLLVGFALSLFYVLLLALSEHFGFGLAYALAAVATVLLIAGYSRSLLGGSRAGWILGSLSLLYGYLYILLQLEDYALLVGAVGLFAVVALIMMATRNLDWFSLRFRGDHGPSSGAGAPV